MSKLYRFLLFSTLVSLFLFAPTFSFEWPDFWYILHQKGSGITAIAGAGDVDGDGKADFILGNYIANGDSGAVFIYSGAIGDLLYLKKGAVDGEQFGYSVAGIGDVNGDGDSDFGVGAPHADPNGLTDAGSVYVYSGATGSLLYRVDGTINAGLAGSSVSGGYDVNGDGKADFVVGAPGYNTSFVPANPSILGSFSVYSGVSGSLVYQKVAPIAGDQLGFSVAMIEDLNADGFSDVIAGAPNVSGGGKIYTYSGSDGSLIFQITNGINGERFGWSVSRIGDINMDGKSDFVVGAPESSPSPLNRAGAAYVLSGVNGANLYGYFGSRNSEFFGSSVSGINDANHDGKNDYVISGNASLASFVYSGSDGGFLFDPKVQGGFGYVVSGCGDVNNDNRGDFIIATLGPAYVFGLLARSIDIFFISDIPFDQGKQLRLRWKSFPGINDSLMDGFIVYRRIDSGMVASSRSQLTPDANALPPGNWEQVAVLLATGDSVYTTVVPTLVDSTSAGTNYSVFFVRGRSINPLLYIDSPLDSGYSVDNLVPSAPSVLAAVGTCQSSVELSYSNPVDPDFQYFKIYRDTVASFTNPIVAGNSIDSFFTDASAPVGKTLYYRVRAVDFSGNESNPSPQAFGLPGLKGDLNIDASLTSSDVVLLLNAVFIGSPFAAPFCAADLNCDLLLTSSDVVLELNAVFLGTPVTCMP